MATTAIVQDPTAFLGYQCALDRAKAVVLPIPFEETTTYGQGTRYGPRAILEASQQVELFDEELGVEPYLRGIHTLDDFIPPSSDPEDAVRRIEGHARAHLSAGRVLVSLGGEHTVSVGLVRAHRWLYPRLSVLQIDAHSDLRPSYEGTPYNHACAMYQITRICPAVQVGIRSMSAGETEVSRRRKTRLFFAREIAGRTGWIGPAVASLTDHVYLTIDLDGFDPSIMPSVGTPEPGGLGWYETLALIDLLAREKTIVGVDIVELCPREGITAPDFLAARLAYKILGYVWRRR